MNQKIPDNDHDLLLIINTKMDSIQSQLNDMDIGMSKFATSVKTEFLAVDERIRYVEGDNRECKTDMKNVKDDINDLQKRSNLWDGFIGAFSILGTILGIIFGNKTP